MPTTDELIQRINEAYDAEEALRDYAFMGIPHIVAGVEVNAMRLPHLAILSQAKNRYICGGQPTELDALQLLWVVSVAREAGELKSSFTAKVDKDRLLIETTEYINDVFLDHQPGAGNSAPIAASSAYIIHRIATAYGWTKEQIEAEPLPILYQLLKLIRLDLNPKAILFNRRSDKARGDLIRELNRSKV
jgi:hypothetical protein